MLRFPMFVDLNGRKAIVIGGGKVGLRRAKILRDFGAEVTVIAPGFSESVLGITMVSRCFRTGDLEGAFLAVAATDDPVVNRAVAEEAKALGIPVNIADCPSECDFFFPAICVEGDLVAGIVGNGADHKKTAEAARRVREVLEELE